MELNPPNRGSHCVATRFHRSRNRLPIAERAEET